jgi:hypothetical protein
MLNPYPPNARLSKPSRRPKNFLQNRNVRSNVISVPYSPACLLAIDTRQIEEAKTTRLNFLILIALLVGFTVLAHDPEGRRPVAAVPDDIYQEIIPVNPGEKLTPLPGVEPKAAAPSTGYDDGKAAYDRGDYVKAYKVFKPLAEQGDADAQWYLGLMYHMGEGVPQDYIEAVKWNRKAAEQGNSAAQRNLGFMYGDGEGVPQDYVLAHMWLNLAAAQGALHAKESRDMVAEKMTPAQLAEAQRLAREWKPKGKEWNWLRANDLPNWIVILITVILWPTVVFYWQRKKVNNVINRLCHSIRSNKSI